MKDLKKWKADPSKGEVFTPDELVNSMLDKIPSEVWTNPNSTFLDPCMGTGVFLIEIVRRLVYIYGYSELDAKSRVYGYEIRVKYINRMLRRGFLNVQHKDFLCDEIKMKFDVVIGNPPYQKQVGPKKTQAIWPEFVEKSFELCKEGGYVSLIHPIGWRDIDGMFKNVQNIIKSKKLIYLEMRNITDGINTFGVKTPYDWYIIENIKNDGSLTKVKDQEGKITEINIINFEFIPNCKFEMIQNLVANQNDNKVKVLYNCSYHHQYQNTSKNSDEEFIYPCVYSINKNSIPTFYYSNTNEKGHFGIPKVIFGNGANPTFMVDRNGDYGMCEFTFGVINYDLDKILKALKSESINLITKSLKYNNTQGSPIFNRKILSTFRENFWEDFLDEDGNVREL